MVVVLRDGKKIIGVLRSFDQYGMDVWRLGLTVQRILYYKMRSKGFLLEIYTGIYMLASMSFEERM